MLKAKLVIAQMCSLMSINAFATYGPTPAPAPGAQTQFVNVCGKQVQIRDIIQAFDNATPGEYLQLATDSMVNHHITANLNVCLQDGYLFLVVPPMLNGRVKAYRFSRF